MAAHFARAAEQAPAQAQAQAHAQAQAQAYTARQRLDVHGA